MNEIKFSKKQLKTMDEQPKKYYKTNSDSIPNKEINDFYIDFINTHTYIKPKHIARDFLSQTTYPSNVSYNKVKSSLVRRFGRLNGLAKRKGIITSFNQKTYEVMVKRTSYNQLF